MAIPGLPFAYPLHLMYEGGYRHVPVVEGGHAIGVVPARDMLGREVEEFEAGLRQREQIGEIIGQGPNRRRECCSATWK